MTMEVFAYLSGSILPNTIYKVLSRFRQNRENMKILQILRST